MLQNTPTASILAAIAIGLSGCGGSDSAADKQAQYERELATASAKLSEFNTVVSNAPCTTSAQCSTITFTSGRNDCERPAPKDYSLVSPTAEAARLAARQYDEAMNRAAMLIPPDDSTLSTCTVVIDPAPLQCTDNKCVRGFSFSGG